MPLHNEKLFVTPKCSGIEAASPITRLEGGSEDAFVAQTLLLEDEGVELLNKLRRVDGIEIFTVSKMGRVRGEYRAKKFKGSNVRGSLVASLLIQGRHVEIIPSSHSIHVVSTIAEACGYIKKRANSDRFIKSLRLVH